MSELPCILYRPGLADPSEEADAREHFSVYRYRAEVPAGSLVVGRYSVLPFADELAHDVELLGSRLVNTYAQHQYLASMGYYEDLQDVTFATWFRFTDVPGAVRGQPFVVKGRTNSRKFEWSSKMFAANFEQAVRVGAELMTDGLIGAQGVVLRQYVPLETFEVSISGLPFTNEWRLFYYQGVRLAQGYYWGNIDNWEPVLAAQADFESNGLAFADAVAQRLVDKAPFVVLDIAKTAAGQWVVVELNDGCQAGLNGTVPAQELYGNLSRILRGLPVLQVPTTGVGQ